MGIDRDLLNWCGLTVKFPFAPLFFHGKDLEVRGTNTAFRGHLLLTQSLASYYGRELTSMLPVDVPHPYQAMGSDFRTYSTLRGVAIGVAELTGTRRMRFADEPRAFVKHRHAYRWVWEIKNVQRLTPFELKGQLGLFYLTPEMLALIEIHIQHANRKS